MTGASKRFPWLMILMMAQAHAGTNWFQDGMNFGQTQLNAAGNAPAMSAAGQTTINNLNQGTNLVQPNGTTVTTMQGYGTTGNANGTGLGSFGTSNVNTCAGYVIGTGGPARDAECNAVGFASQTTNLTAQANSAYNLTGQSSFLQSALSANSGAGANMSNLLPATTTSVTGTTSCTQQPTTSSPTTQSCYVYNNQSTGGGTITSWSAGSFINVTCTGGATLSTTSCTINPPQISVSVNCLSTSQNSSSGTAQSFSTGSPATVTCTGGATTTNNTCTTPSLTQTTTSTMCYAQQQNTSSGTPADYPTNSSITVNCTAPANLSNTYCSVTTPLDAQTTSQTCQKSVPVTKTCDQIASANVTTTTIHTCTSGSYPVYTTAGGCWDGRTGNCGSGGSSILIGSVNVTCLPDNTGATIQLDPSSAATWMISPTSGTVYYGVPSGGAATMCPMWWNGSCLSPNPGDWSWNGSGYFYAANTNTGTYAGGLTFTFPIGVASTLTATPTYTDGCATWANM